jgi:hypothetical protein
MLEVRWYYRPAEIPPNLYHLLIEDRYHENREFYLEILNPFNIILYCPFLSFFLFFHSSPMCNDASSDGSVSQCLYKSLYNVYSKMSFVFCSIVLSYEASRRRFSNNKKRKEKINPNNR